METRGYLLEWSQTATAAPSKLSGRQHVATLTP